MVCIMPRLIAPLAGARSVQLLASLAAMFAGEPPSSSNPTKRLSSRMSSLLESFRRLLLQIGGANLAAWIAPTSSALGDEEACPLTSPQHGGAGSVFDCSARWRSLCPIARFARCDVRWGAAVFVESDETTV